MHNIWERFVNNNDPGASKQPDRERNLVHHHELLIIAIVLEQPDIYLRELCQYIKFVTGTSVSESTIICRLEKKAWLYM